MLERVLSSEISSLHVVLFLVSESLKSLQLYVFARVPHIIMCLSILHILHIFAFITTKISISRDAVNLASFACVHKPASCCLLQIIYSCVPPPGSM